MSGARYILHGTDAVIRCDRCDVVALVEGFDTRYLVEVGLIVLSCRERGWRFELHSKHCVIGVPEERRRSVLRRFRSVGVSPASIRAAFNSAVEFAAVQKARAS